MTFTSFDGDQLGYLKWGKSTTPSTVVIAVHGINGAASDYSGLGGYLEKHSTSTSLYAAETRGQGNDPNTRRRGDIYRPEEWYNDLSTFSRHIRQLHPDAKIIWCGESMGTLIVTHTIAHHSNSNIKQSPPCDGIILLAPVVDLSHQLPKWKLRIANVIAAVFPRFRLSLTALSGEDSVKVTQGSDNHETQAATNSYWIPKFTLRLLSTLGNHISSMPSIAPQLTPPSLIINGGKDYFTPAQYIEQYISHFPNPQKVQHHFYPAAYHLLMYDDQRLEIFSTISQWLSEQSTMPLDS